MLLLLVTISITVLVLPQIEVWVSITCDFVVGFHDLFQLSTKQ